jgi:hypothetical protein
MHARPAIQADALIMAHYICHGEYARLLMVV